MKLKSFEYVEFGGTPREWSLSKLTLGSINLLVGKNATGKTRTLNVINELARMLSGKVKPEFASGTYTATFENEGRDLHYVLEMANSKVVKEEFVSD